MRIEVRAQGGFAGLRRPPLALETAELEPETARRMEELAAGLPAGGGPPARGADLMRYDITVDDTTFTYHEPDVPPQARELLRLAREVGRSA
jgi:hypothetical protein